MPLYYESLYGICTLNSFRAHFVFKVPPPRASDTSPAGYLRASDTSPAGYGRAGYLCASATSSAPPRI